MKIKKITNQHRRDFSAMLECEHCGHLQVLNSGYDDENYHQNVIPKIECLSCKKTAPSDYRGLQPKHSASTII